MHPEPLFSIFGNGVTLYGIFNAVGVLSCFVLLYFIMRIKKFNDASSDTILLIGIIATGFGFLAAALFQGFYNLIANPKGGFDIKSGRTFIGGLIGGIALFLGVWNLYIYVIYPRLKAKYPKIEMNAALNDAVPFIPIGICVAHAFGRLGCFFGGCCYGMEAEWGLPCEAWSDVNVIPTQLFEMAFLFILAGVMAVLYFKTKFRNNLSVYLIAYGIWRFALEYLRDDDRGEIWRGANVTPSQFWSILMVIIGIGYIFAHIYYFRKLMKHPELSAQAAMAVPEGNAKEVAAPANSAEAIDEDSKEVAPEADKDDKPEDNKNP